MRSLTSPRHWAFLCAFMDGKLEAQRSAVTCPQPHRYCRAELGLLLKFICCQDHGQSSWPSPSRNTTLSQVLSEYGAQGKEHQALCFEGSWPMWGSKENHSMVWACVLSSSKPKF